MGQAGAQREPSMEEILASIRRIIENNDPAGDAEAMAAFAETHDNDAHGDIVDAHAAGVEIPGADDGHAGFFSDEPAEELAREQETEHEQATAHEQDQDTEHEPVAPARPDSVSLADVAARLRLAPEQAAAIADDVGEGSDAATGDAGTEELRQALRSNEPVMSIAAKVATPEMVETAAPENLTAEIAKAENPHAASSQLVSLQTGEKVAAAFDELNAAIAAGQTRSFDEIAEEMLRPMLTQWLDDNLPTLVERLVREEIERVSRGNRR